MIIVKMFSFREFSVVICAIIVLFIGVNAKKYHVPVLIWDSSEETPRESTFSSLARLNSDDFFNYFLKKVHQPEEKSAVVLFIAETLSVEDFNLQAFKSLKNIAKSGNVDFLPSVENPVSALTGTEIKSYGYNVENLDKENDNLKGGQIYTVKQEDSLAFEDRGELLSRFDENIRKIFEETKQNKTPVTYILTGNYPSWTGPEEVLRVRRQANATLENVTASSGYVLEGQQFLLYSSKPPVLKVGDEEVILNKLTPLGFDDREKFQRAVFAASTELGNLKLRFRFEHNGDHWSFPEIEFEGLKQPEGFKLVPRSPIQASFNHSYITGQAVEFKNSSSSVTFVDLQIQPWLLGAKKFGEAEDSVPFFTAPIWSGIIVISLLAVIMIWALTMIMDIRTMDQFDDPKGKTITVNVTD